MKKKLKIAGLVALAALIIIQFFPIDTTNPVSDPSQDIFANYEAEDALVIKVKEACYDCHSNNTEYPWYTRLQPVGWWLKGHVNEGRKHLNFSEFANYSEKKAKHKFEEAVEYTEKGWMPISSFKVTHPEARLTDLERSAMVDWFKEQYEKI
ncbi:heme-binding domain-containing protein [Portibacter marinus]|uniref:heme-binding domain-containing protein n=1 Tax=Portibacter marinus TaxID=2898660 RepID=UPI001F1F62E1|nr:heme-binding domain-containing protein [Portibacter marinus]